MAVMSKRTSRDQPTYVRHPYLIFKWDWTADPPEILRDENGEKVMTSHADLNEAYHNSKRPSRDRES